MNEGSCRPISIQCVTSKILLNKIFCWLQKALSTQNSTIPFYNSYNLFFLCGFSFANTDGSQDNRRKEGTIFSSFPPPLAYQDSDTFFFFLIGIHSMQGWTATSRHGVTRKKKKAQKRLQLQKICLERTYC